MTKREMRINCFYHNTVTHHGAGQWTHPRDESSRHSDPLYWEELAKTLERGFFDGIFFGDVDDVYDTYGGSGDTAIKRGLQFPSHDPMLTVPIMSRVTENLGFGFTVKTSEDPVSFTRKMSTLDHLTHGRVAWNIVTGYLSNSTNVKHDQRYEMAEEYMEFVYKLWEGAWDDDAVIADRENCIYTDPTKVRKVRHNGKFIQRETYHLVDPSPQRTPVLYQAGSSPRGMQFASRHAECTFIGGPTKEAARRTVDSLIPAITAAGRRREDMKIFSWMTTVIGSTDEEANKLLDEYRQYSSFDGAMALFSGWTGIDFSQYSPEDKVTDIDSNGIKSFLPMFKSIDSEREWTLRDITEHVALAGMGPVLVGSPESIADQLEEWMDFTGVDGFNLARLVTPEGYTSFVDHVVPELQRRGRFKRSYEEGTYRNKLFGTGDRIQHPHVAASFRNEHADATALTA